MYSSQPVIKKRHDIQAIQLPLDYYLRRGKCYEKSEEGMERLCLCVAPFAELIGITWKVEVFFSSEECPLIPLFSTFIYSKHDWFNSQGCSNIVDCPFSNTERFLACSGSDLSHWDPHHGFLQDFKLETLSDSHCDTRNYSPHAVQGKPRKVEGTENTFVFVKKLFLGEDVDDYALSSSIHWSLCGGQYKIYFKNAWGNMARVRSSTRDILEEKCYFQEKPCKSQGDYGEDLSLTEEFGDEPSVEY